VLDIPPEERFVSFVEFNKFLEIGFFSDVLSIECCSHFCFMTVGAQSNDV